MKFSKDGFTLAEIPLNENNYLVVEMYTPKKGKDEGRNVLNLRVFTRKLYRTDPDDKKKVYLTPQELRSDPQWIPTGNGFMVRETQASSVLPKLIEGIEKAMKLWAIEKLDERKGKTK